MPTLIALLAAGYGGWLVYRLAPLSRGYWARRAQRMLSEAEERESLPFGRALLLPLADAVRRFAPAAWLLDTEADLYWAQLAGGWSGWSAGDVWALRLVLAGLGLGYGLLWASKPIAGAGAGAVGLFFPSMRLHGQAEKTRRRFLRELPDAAQNLALLAAVGVSVGEALRRLAEGQGLVSQWVRETLALAAGQQLLSSSEQEGGVLRRRAEESRLPALINLAVQLDLVQRSGTSAGQLLGDLATNVAQGYESEMAERAEKLGATLVFPTMIFYFIPYIVAILAPVAFSILRGF
jgi:Flp pilus assembly protein TadB